MELQPIENAIVIHPHLLQKFMKHGKDYANLIALYSFYIYHAQLQKTNKPLATDEFARKGMNWAIDRVKKTKKILKEMKVIEVVQYKKYYYVHLFFIYTKKKIDEILGKITKTESVTQKNPETPKKEVIKKEVIKEETKSIELKPSTPVVPPLLTQWLEYCDKNSIRYTKKNITLWQKSLENRLTIEQQKAIYKAISCEWKNFYITPLKESKYHKFLGKSLMMKRDCDTLLDISYKNDQYVYKFKNIKITSTGTPQELFNRYGYSKLNVKTAPIASQVKEKLMGMFQKF